MYSAFDSVAIDYDAKFTQTKIGGVQRKIVWTYLNKILEGKSNLKILELNCGTGEDAVWLAKKGHNVLATDISEEMLHITEQKALHNQLSDRIETRKIDLTKIEKSDLNENFDLIFSNFGGINCIPYESLYDLPNTLIKLIKPSGRLIMVIMPTFCLWEIFYFALKLNFKKAFRRSSTKGVRTKINEMVLLANYYTPVTIKRIFRKKFISIAVKPVGFFIPPSYLEKFFSSKDKAFKLLCRLESSISNSSILANYSDHFLIDFENR
jgi:ubiquinone/menaquinone biosynthesis C-methylase UbiE